MRPKKCQATTLLATMSTYMTSSKKILDLYFLIYTFLSYLQYSVQNQKSSIVVKETCWPFDDKTILICFCALIEWEKLTILYLLNLLFSFLFFFSSNNQSRNFFRHFLQPMYCFRYQFGHGAKYLEDSIPLCSTMSHPNNVFHSGRFGVFLSQKYEGRICPKNSFGPRPKFFGLVKIILNWTKDIESFGKKLWNYGRSGLS